MSPPRPRHPRRLIVLLLGFAVIAVMYSIATPPFETPDEVWHYGMVQQIATHRALPVAYTKDDPRFWESVTRQQAAQAPAYYVVAAILTGWIDQRAFPDMYAQRFNLLSGMGQPDSAHKAIFLHYEDEGWPGEGPFLAVHLVRLFSILLSAVTLWATFQGIRLIVGDEIALLGTAIFAFVPQFVFISAAVSNDNAINAVAALVLWRLIVLSKESPSAPSEHVGSLVLIGVLVGLGILAKISGLWLVPLVMTAVLILAWRQRSLTFFVRNTVLVLAVALLISGWWLLRNWQLYGDPLALSVWMAAIDLRSETAGLATILNERESLELSFWGVFGWFNITYPHWIYTFFRLLEGLGLLGLVGVLWRARGSTVAAWRRQGIAILVIWILMLTISWIGFMRVAPAAQGRYVFSAAPTLALLLGTGLSFWRAPRGALWLGWSVVGLLVLLNLATPWVVIREAYRPSPLLTELPQEATSTNIQFGRSITLVGYQLNKSMFAPGERVPLTLYWRTSAPLPENYVVSVKGWQGDATIITREEGHPDGGRWPTEAWPVNRIIIDRHTLPLPSGVETPQLLRFSVELYNFAPGADHHLRQLPASQAGKDVSVPVYFSSAAVRSGVPALPAEVEFRVKPVDVAVEIEPPKVTVDFSWLVGEALPKSYQALFHLVDQTEGPPLQTADFAPLEGRLPTDLWLPGDRHPDSATMELPMDLPVGVYQLEIGLYDLSTGVAIESAPGVARWGVAELYWDGQRWSEP